MMRALASCLAVCVIAAASPAASGRTAIYGIVEKVKFEPNEKSPERVQVWGVFSYVEESAHMSTAGKGYLYFKLPDPALAGPGQVEVVKKEWADLRAVAGTGQAVSFGAWNWPGNYVTLLPDTRGSLPPSPSAKVSDLRIRPASEAPVGPMVYQTNTGIVRLAALGTHAAIIKYLQDALKR